jgi:hypothetical protein
VREVQIRFEFKIIYEVVEGFENCKGFTIYNMALGRFSFSLR